MHSHLPALSEAQALAVEEEIRSLDMAAKVGQLFCLYLHGPETGQLLADWEKAGLAPGAVLLLARDAEQTRDDVALAQAWSSVPLLVAANLEKGAGVMEISTMRLPILFKWPPPAIQSRRDGSDWRAAAGAANWASTGHSHRSSTSDHPQNPIVRTRAFGRDPELVAAMGSAYVSAVQACGVAATLKHWPGDGVDGRDQHLLTTDNTMDLVTWRATFGEVYRAGIRAGAMTVMPGHIRLPALTDDTGAGGRVTEICRRRSPQTSFRTCSAASWASKV